ncbi:MAG: DMT family transporter [Rubrivivax sp.]|nr:DMT family transporter [Rubrivivax sp.]
MRTDSAALLRAMPLVFVLIWSTGFVVARFAMPHAPPLGFLTVRYALSILAFLVWIGWAGARWPPRGTQWLHLGLTGVLMHAGYLGGVWIAVKGGLGAGLAALIVGLQPILTALWLSLAAGSAGAAAGSAGGRVQLRQWLGLVLGLAGLLLVLGHKLELGEATLPTLAAAAVALLSITAGTLYQKRWVQPCDVRTANAVQLIAALLLTAPLALLEPGRMELHPELIGALAWSVLVLTLGGSSLLYLLIQRGAATAVTSLMYLVPPTTALMAWWLFDEALGPGVLAGLALTAVGVALIVRRGNPIKEIP